MSLGKMLKQTLKIRGLSQAELASMLGIPPTTLNGYILDRYEPDCTRLKEIAGILGVSTDYLLRTDSYCELNKDEILIVQKSLTLSKRRKDMVMEQINFLETQKNGQK
jgi:transcriptional regulator with XRE-family HTH domain